MPALMIVACVGQKGGIGKSTIAIALAAEGVARGRTVLLVDGDRQATVRTWAATAAEHDHPVPTVIAMDATMHRPPPRTRQQKRQARRPATRNPPRLRSAPRRLRRVRNRYRRRT